jgi:hypothetical protein
MSGSNFHRFITNAMLMPFGGSPAGAKGHAEMRWRRSEARTSPYARPLNPKGAGIFAKQATVGPMSYDFAKTWIKGRSQSSKITASVS